MARAKGTRAATIRQRNVNQSSTKRQPVINQASTERQPVINETSTGHQIGDFLDENGNNATLVAINGTRSVVWLTRMPWAGTQGVPTCLDWTINSADARPVVPRGLLGSGVQDSIDANATVRSVVRWDAFSRSHLRLESMAGANDDEDNER